METDLKRRLGFMLYILLVVRLVLHKNKRSWMFSPSWADWSTLALLSFPLDLVPDGRDSRLRTYTMNWPKNSHLINDMIVPTARYPGSTCSDSVPSIVGRFESLINLSQFSAGLFQLLLGSSLVLEFLHFLSTFCFEAGSGGASRSSHRSSFSLLGNDSVWPKYHSST